MNADKLDNCAHALYLEVPAGQMVLLQALFENYEGLGTVRTLDAKRSLVCLLTTTSLLQECITTLEAIRPMVAWREWADSSDARKYLNDIC